MNEITNKPHDAEREYVIQKVQPALLGLRMDEGFYIGANFCCCRN